MKLWGGLALLAGLGGWLGAGLDVRGSEGLVEGQPVFQLLTKLSDVSGAVQMAQKTDTRECGLAALRVLARALEVEPGRLAALEGVVVSAEGLSLAELVRLGERVGLSLVAVCGGARGEMPVPSIAHLRREHFVAVLRREGERVWVEEGAGGRSGWRLMSDLARESSGKFVVPSELGGMGRERLPLEAAGGVRGAGTGDPERPLPDDMQAEGCPTYEQVSEFPSDPEFPATEGPEACPKPEQCPPGHEGDECAGAGMAVWQVLEPSLNLVVRDMPLFYTMSDGRRLPFALFYRQRALPSPTNVFGVGEGWECSWRMYMQVIDGRPYLRSPVGSQRDFADVYEYMYDVYGTHVSVLTDLKYELAYRLYCRSLYTNRVAGGPGVTNVLVTTMADPHGRSLRFEYETTNGIERLARVIDYDNRTSRLYYTNQSFPRFITDVEDPYQRKATLRYNGQGRLEEIVDMQGLRCQFAYDGQGLLTNMITPYGTTRFEARTNDFDTNTPIARALLVTLPNGATNLFVYRDRVDTLPDSFDAPSDLPDGEYFENGMMKRRNSFFWNSRQMAQLSTAWTNLMTQSNAPASDFVKARLRHWGWVSRDDGTYVSSRLLVQRWPSPDGVTEGRTLWFKYPWSYPNAWPYLMAETLPSGQDRYVHWERNDWGLPTKVTSTYADGAGRGTRVHQYVFDENGAGRRLLEVRGPATDQWGNPLLARAYGYNEDCQVTSLTNALGEVTRCDYAADRALTRVSYPWGLVVSNLYDANGWLTNRLLQTSDGAPLASERFGWTQGKVRTHTDARGLTVTNSWDNLSRLTERAYPDQTTISNSYTKLEGPNCTGGTELLGRTRFKDRLNRWTSFSYDLLGLVAAVTNALDRVTRYDWCDCGYLESLTDPLGNLTIFNHDLQGRLTGVVYPGAGLVSIGWDKVGQPTNVADAAGWVGLSYNHQGLWAGAANSAGTWWQVDYDLKDRPTNVLFASGLHLTNAYDALDRLVSRTEVNSNAVEHFGYSPNVPWLTAFTNQLGANVALLAYDVLGRLTRQAFGYASGTNFIELTTNGFSYGPGGDLLTLADGKGQTTRWTCDAYGRAVAKTNAADGVVWTNGYNSNGWLTKHWTPAKLLTQYAYDAVGNLTNINYPASPDVSLAYDALNRLTNLVDAAGATAFGWTGFGALAWEDGPWASDTVGFGCNEARRRQSLSLQQPNATAWSQAYAYDSSWRLTNLVSPAGAFGYTYRDASRLISRLRLPNAAYITNIYDPLGRWESTALRSSTNGLLNFHGYQYDAAHERTRQTFTASNYVDYGYDPVGQLISANGREAGGAARVQEQLGYGYDAAGNLNLRTNNALVQAFTITNLLNQLDSVSRSGTFTVAGMATPQVTNVTVNGLAATLYGDKTFAQTNVSLNNGQNTFTAIGTGTYGRKDTNTVTVNLPQTATYHYDLNGNLVSDGQRGFEYDDENQLIAVTATNSWRSEFVYDGLGRRRVRVEKVWKNSQWTTTAEVRYVYDHMLVLQERDQNNIPQVTYTRGVDLSGGLQRAGGIGGLLARTEPLAFSLQPSYFHADAVGNITALIDTNQTVDARYHYDPYGNLLGLSGSMAEANLYRFSSKEFHPNSGLYYYGYRLYAPGLQRWVNRDPIGEFGGCNLYCYVRNRPLQFFDPFGFSWYDDVADWWAEQVALSQDYLDANAPWWLAGTSDTVLDIGLGLASTPQAFGHLGEGTGTFSAEPTLEHAAGLAQDVSLIAGTLVGCKLKATECVDHHSIPRGTLKKLPKPVREHPDVRGRKGNPNIRRVPKDWHDKVHSSPPGQYYPGGEYNRRFDLMIEEGRGYRTVTPEEVIEIRDQLMSDFQP